MKALSIHQPWASLIMAGVKRVENRTWSTNHRGPLAIHAGNRYDHEGAEWLRLLGMDAPGPEDCPRGALLGTVELVDCVRFDAQQSLPGMMDELTDNPLATGPWCWIVQNPRTFAEPVSVVGQQCLWDLDPDRLPA